MGKTWRTALILGLAFLLAIAGTFTFAYRAGRHARQMRWSSEPVRAWMSVPFIAHAHHVPASVLYQAIGVQPQGRDRRSVRHIARDQKRSVSELMSELQRALDSAAHQPSSSSTPSGKDAR